MASRRDNPVRAPPSFKLLTLGSSNFIPCAEIPALWPDFPGYCSIASATDI